MATGCIVTAALEAERTLRPRGIECSVISASTLKPLDPESVLSEVEGAKAVVTAEEHSVIGGLGGAVAEALRHKPVPMEFVGIHDCFGVSGADHAQLMGHYGLTAAAIVKAVERILSYRQSFRGADGSVSESIGRTKVKNVRFVGSGIIGKPTAKILLKTGYSLVCTI